jgi:hypothetical protein
MDFIPTSLLKSCSPVVAPIIAKLANLSFDQGSIPAALKTARVTPLFNKPSLDPKLPSNYRPISNLNTISEVFEEVLERLVLVRVRDQIVSSNNFPRKQSTYRPGHSCETMMLGLANDLYSSIATDVQHCCAPLISQLRLTRSITKYSQIDSALILDWEDWWVRGCDRIHLIALRLLELDRPLHAQQLCTRVCLKAQSSGHFCSLRISHQSVG